ncbi:MAG: CPBP family intramembrane metalloprotease [Gammaproteobacteria bacterium]|nr:CPBP family intramembrane metalloprotease [Gammaproteobacteria bacterium]MCY4210587.1 CPBP family intramembrane metalloprotease [Gammaproteobacteria bacterium]MCY4282564.1 CPBP family intramembrane metalloprotease [Gammaproteobacteria bacterium]MCY4339254.1 CPBP family intramembrane metalloprotease [Gammaproteobacteria bacterium]
MRALLVFATVFLSAILAGALLAYPVYEFFASSGALPFRKVVSRTTQLSGLLFSLLYFCYYRGLSLQGLGLRFERGHICLLQGLAAGFAVVALIAANLVLLGVHDLNESRLFSFSALSQLLLTALLTGLLVGIVEELMFRGALLGGLSRQTNQAVALALVSLVYAAVHYLKFRDLPADAAIHWYTGITMLPAALFQFADPARYDAMLTLFFLGLLLGLIRLYTGNLLLCIGLHAGVVSGEKLVQHVADFMPYSPHAHLVNRFDPFIGNLASVWLLAVSVVFYFACRAKKV